MKLNLKYANAKHNFLSGVRSGQAKVPKEYSIWSAMRDRCNNPRSRAWKDYGGRGIYIDARWDSFDVFYADMGPKPPGKSIDRINNDGPYGPENCRWATQKEQLNNRRNSIKLSFNGKSQSIEAWAIDLGISKDALVSRLKRKWTLDRALTNRDFRKEPQVKVVRNRNAKGQFV